MFHLSVTPSNLAIEKHFNSFLVDGFDTAREKIDICFPDRKEDNSVPDFSLGYVDGQTKVIICLLIVTLCESEGLAPEEIKGSKLADTLKSFRLIKINYKHFDRPDKHIMEALSTDHQISRSFIVALSCC